MAPVAPTKAKKIKWNPVWKGPAVDGITQSLLSRFLVDRERFRLLVVEGLQPADTFNHRLEYGNMWHLCEEWYARNPSGDDWIRALLDYAKQLCQRYQTQQPQVQHWYNVCKVQFPIYVEYWKKHPDVKSRKPILQEESFKVPYELASGRVVLLRGKWDSVDYIGGSGGIYLQENKSKGDIDEQQLKRQLSFDLQTMLYLVALGRWLTTNTPRLKDTGVIKGIRYNVIRRPLSGGKNTIRKHQPTKANPLGESDEDFYKRLGGLIEEDPGYYFMRWKVEIIKADTEKFKLEFLEPCLESLCDWWEWIERAGKLGVSPFIDSHEHWRTPYGFYNVLAEGGSSDLDEYLATKSELGLQRATTLFPELE